MQTTEIGPGSFIQRKVTERYQTSLSGSKAREPDLGTCRAEVSPVVLNLGVMGIVTWWQESGPHPQIR